MSSDQVYHQDRTKAQGGPYLASPIGDNTTLYQEHPWGISGQDLPLVAQQVALLLYTHLARKGGDIQHAQIHLTELHCFQLMYPPALQMTRPGPQRPPDREQGLLLTRRSIASTLVSLPHGAAGRGGQGSSLI